ncbi:MAG: cobalamin-binding protein [Abditibacteriales bacterium]|nr:cobalamin-binding protein [Abditibacteriales bacterium]MDW8368387.1 cobalamin-binding protein [Abditibacteriales bacterium]
MKRLCLLSIVVAACVVAATAARKPAISLKDDLGHVITLEQYPQRIVSLAPSCTEYLFAAGLSDRIVGVTSYCKYPPEAQTKPVLGDIVNTNVERILLAKPDLVLAAYGNPMSALDKLRQAGIAVFGFNPKTFEEIFNAILRTGKLGGTERTAQAFVASQRRRLEQVRRRTQSLPAAKRPRVFYCLDPGPPIFTAGGSSIVDEAIRLAGGINVAHHLTKPMYPTYSAEMLVKQNPDVLVFAKSQGREVNPEEFLKSLRNDSMWRALSAVQWGRVCLIPVELLGSPTPRAVMGVEQLARCLHPDLFAEPQASASGR